MKIETWNTRFGTSVRVVTRDKKGRLTGNKSDRQIVSVILDLDDRGLYSAPKKVYTRRGKVKK